MNYYEQLYDIDFFSCNAYAAQIDAAFITIRKPGTPDWTTWRGTYLSAHEAEKLWKECQHTACVITTLGCGPSDPAATDKLLLALILCEQAYRDFNGDTFFKLNRLLYSSSHEDVRLKAIKLHTAWKCLVQLVGPTTSCESPPLQILCDQALAYLAGKPETPRSYTIDDVAVETPVREDWVCRKIDTKDTCAVEDFYKTSFAYILELTAANHQVQTLFNYAIILDILKKSGVRKIFDYGAGIGTFLALASAYGIEGVHADFDSESLRFAKARYASLGLAIPTIEIRPDTSVLPTQADCIVCTEVLEHVFNPEELVRQIHAALRPGGLFVVSESFDYIDEFCSHLPMHQGKGGEVFLTFMKSQGFRQIPTGYLLHPSIHVRL